MRPTLEDMIGEVVDGKYRVEAMLGRGGMGAVFRAVHEGTGRTVALKVISPRLASEPEFLQRFQREARACGRLRHPNIVDVTDFGAATHRGDLLAYLVMEYLDGSSLADVLRQESNLPLEWCVDVIEQICSAVDEAHRAGILHRDLKPDNIWLEPNRRGGYTVKVLDFGLAKLSGSASTEAQPGHNSSLRNPTVTDAPTRDGLKTGPTLATIGEANEPTLARTISASSPADLTQEATLARPAPAAAKETFPKTAVIATDDEATRAGSILGTPAYMAPEQILGQTVTPRTDVYSLGVIAYGMIAGKAPFAGSTDELVDGHLHRMPPPIQDLRKDLPKEAADVVMSALAKDPAARPDNALAFAAQLSARFETPRTFLHNAALLFLSHIGAWMRLAVLCFSPILVAGIGLAILAIAEAAGWVSLPWATRPAARLVPVAFLLGSGLSFFALGGAVIPAAMQAVAAPLRPISLPFLLRSFKPRFLAWMRMLLPLIGALSLLVLMVPLLILILDPLLDWLRPLAAPFSRGTRIALVLVITGPTIAIPLLLGLALMRHFGGVKAFQFLGPVMLVEGFTGRQALRRSEELQARAGQALQPVQIATMISAGLFGGFLGAASGASRDYMSPVAFAGAVGPLTAVCFTLGGAFLSLVGALTYIRARRAMGEPLDRVLADFERSVLPADHWQLAQRDQIRRQISLSR